MIDSDYDYHKLELYKELALRESPFLTKIDDVYNFVKNLLNTRIPMLFPKYTQHDTGHSFRIIDYMGKIVSDIKKLDDLEIVLLLYSALLHDIGMAANEEDVLKIKADNFDVTDVKFSTLKRINNYDDTIALQEYIRRIHSQLSARFIRANVSLFTLPSPNSPTLNFAEELALICESHTQDIDWVKRNLSNHEVRGEFYFNAQFIAGILRLADILDIDSSRTPYGLYKNICPQGVSDEEWKQHFIISNTEKIEIDSKTQLKRIVFYGSSDNPTIHRKLLFYLDWVRDELNGVSKLVNNMPEIYNLTFESTIVNNIQTINFTYSDYKMSLDFKAISALLMGEKIYGDKSLGLRELIQNSIDACRLKEEKLLATRAFGEEKYRAFIKVILNRAENKVIIKDNGIGMSLNVIKKHFLNIGVSYYSSDEFKLRDFKYQPIGNFGIGFLSGFMLSSQVKVITRTMDSNVRYVIELEKGSEYTSLTNVADLTFEGTEVVLKYNEFIGLFTNTNNKVKVFLEKYFLTDGIEFSIIDMDDESIERVENRLNDTKPLEEGLFRVEFKTQLKDIEGYALVKPRRNFIKSFSDLVFDGDLYLYNREAKSLDKVENIAQIMIDDYIIDKELSYLAVPLIDSYKKDKFLNGLEYTGNNVEEVVETFAHEIEWISILCPKNLVEEFDEKNIKSGESIIDELYFRDLVSLGHSEDCLTRTYIKTIDLYEGEKNRLYMPFHKERELDRWLFSFGVKEENKNLFIRSVLIKDFSYFLPTTANVFEITKIVTNVTSREFIPDISRNNLDFEACSDIGYMIGKAVHKSVLNLPFLSNEEKETLRKFNETYYANVTPFEIIEF